MIQTMVKRAPFALGKVVGSTQDWLATGASVASVLGSLVAFDLVQRIAWRIGPTAQQDAAVGMARAINASTRFAGATVTLRGLSQVDQSRNYIVVCNHQSMLDISMLTQHLSALRPRYVSKRELARGVPGVSYNLRRGGSALIDRKDSAQARAAIADITRRIRDEKLTVVIFPEGTRSKTGAMKPFKVGGLRELVLGAPGVPILPVTSFGGSLLFSRSLKPIVRDVELGMVFHAPVAAPPGDDEAGFTAFVKDLAATIASGLPRA
jgi:1-acyl-sn-glycerol-3-phosphate acyltransferase